MASGKVKHCFIKLVCVSLLWFSMQNLSSWKQKDLGLKWLQAAELIISHIRESVILAK